MQMETEDNPLSEVPDNIVLSGVQTKTDGADASDVADVSAVANAPIQDEKKQKKLEENSKSGSEYNEFGSEYNCCGYILYVFIIFSEALSVNYTWSVFIEFLFGDPHRLKLLDE